MYLKTILKAIQHALHTFGGRRIEDPPGGSTAAPPPFVPSVQGKHLGLCVFLAFLAFLTFLVFRQWNDHWKETSQKMFENLEKIVPKPFKIEPWGVQNQA